MEIIRQKKRMMPLIILADVSYSMVDNMEILNQAIDEMINSLKNTHSLRAEINLSIITFGGEVKIHTPLQAIRDVDFKKNLVAYSNTPLGGALTKAKNMIESREIVPSDGYKPVVVLLSDGYPTDDYKECLRKFTSEGRSQKSERLSLGIGEDFSKDVLESFTNHSKKKIFLAKDAAGIMDFFKFVTMSMKEKSISTNPDEVMLEEEKSFKDFLDNIKISKKPVGKFSEKKVGISSKKITENDITEDDIDEMFNDL
ncbi:MAG: vWA domain-containing protein [Fusobacteriaceae bacterium]